MGNNYLKAYVESVCGPPDPYGWIITRDAKTDGETCTNEKGTIGPADITDEINTRLLAGEGEEFRLTDDDGIHYMYGRLIVTGDPDEWVWDLKIKPLDDIGEAYGAVAVAYKNDKGEWENYN